MYIPEEDSLPIFDGRTKEEREKAKVAYLQKLPEIVESNASIYLKRHGIPENYMDASLASFKGYEGIVAKCNEYLKNPNRNIMLEGKCGSGKTHIACAIIRELVKSDKQALFMGIPEILMELRSSYKESSQHTEQEIINYLSKVPFLVMDDLGAEKTSEYSISSFYLILDNRINRMLPTIITTNLSLGMIEKAFGARIASRLSGFEIWHFDMPDYRKK